MVVFIGQDSPQLTELFDRLGSWSSARIAREFCTVTLCVDGGPLKAAVRRVRNGEVEETTFGLAVSHLDLAKDPVRLVGVVPFVATSEDRGASSCQEIQTWVEGAEEILPNDALNPEMADLVLLPDGYETPVNASCFDHPWRQVFLVAPEDRAGPNSSNLLSEQPERLSAHATHALLALTGLIGPKKAPLASFVPKSVAKVSGQSTALIARHYSRILDVGDLANAVGELVFEADEVWRTPGTEFEPVEDSSPQMRGLAAVFLDEFDEVFGLSKFEPRVLEAEPELSLMEAIREFFRVLQSFVLRLPTMIWHFLVGRIHDAIAVKLEKGFEKLGDPRLVKRYADRFAPSNKPAFQQGGADLTPNDADGEVRSAWRGFVALHLGLIDGSPMPLDSLKAAVRRDRFTLVEPDPRKIVPDPSAIPPEPAPGIVARACDPRALDPELRRALLEAPVEAVAEEISESEADPAAESIEAAAVESSAETSTAAPIENAEPEVDPDAEYVAEWVDPHRATPAWIIGYRLAQNLLTAKSEKLEEDEVLHLSKEDEATQAGEQEEREREGKGFLKVAVRKVRLRSIILAVLTGAAIYGLGDHRSIFTVAAVCVLSFVIWLCLATRCVQWYMKQNERVIRTQVERWIAVQNEIDLGRQRAGDFLRLSRRYSHYLEWAEIVGWMAHRPWARDKSAAADSAPFDTELLPAAATVARPEHAEAFEGAANLLAGKLFVPRWLTDHYNATESEIVRSWAVERGLIDPTDPDAKLPDPALASQSPDSELRELPKRLRVGNALTISATTDDGSGGLAPRFLRSLNGLHVDHVVNGIKTDPGALKQSFEFDRPTEFFHAIVEIDGGREVSSKNFRTVTKGETDIVAVDPEELDTTSMTVSSLTGGVELGVPLRIVVCLTELTRQIEPGQLSVFSKDERVDGAEVDHGPGYAEL